MLLSLIEEATFSLKDSQLLQYKETRCKVNETMYDLDLKKRRKTNSAKRLPKP
jgi:hypothetical protein